jgi:hypothetical protein
MMGTYVELLGSVQACSGHTGARFMRRTGLIMVHYSLGYNTCD